MVLWGTLYRRVPALALAEPVANLWSGGIVELLDAEPAREHWHGVREAAAVCPAAAIFVVREDQS